MHGRLREVLNTDDVGLKTDDPFAGVNLYHEDSSTEIDSSDESEDEIDVE